MIVASKLATETSTARNTNSTPTNTTSLSSTPTSKPTGAANFHSIYIAGASLTGMLACILPFFAF